MARVRQEKKYLEIGGYLFWIIIKATIKAVFITDK
jgi:hypothetical protein